MDRNFQICLKEILRHEGGYVNHPRDPGGPTNYGITQGTLSAHLGRGATVQDVKHISLKTVSEIYYKKYWRLSQCHALPSGVDFMVFNASVNCGPKRGARFLQQALNKMGSKLVVDSDIGLKTVEVSKKVNRDELINHYSKIQMSYYRRLKTFKTFGKGWARRTKESVSFALNMEEDKMSPFDLLVGNRLTGYKTIIAVISYVLLSAAQSHDVINLDPKLFNTIIDGIIAFGGLSLMAKVERYLDMFGLGAKK